MTDVNSNPETGGEEPSRRDFLYIASVGAVGVGGALTLWPFIDQMNPAADTLALSTTEINIGELEEGAEITVMFRERPTRISYVLSRPLQHAKKFTNK